MQPSYSLLHVADPAGASRFWGRLLGREPVETSPTFCLFALDGGPMLGLWSRDTVEPAPGQATGSGELGFRVDRPEDVDTTCAGWRRDGLAILQEPTDMDFGRSFVAESPDGHRLRVFALAQ